MSLVLSEGPPMIQRTTLPTGREVIDTGKVLIGLRAEQPPAQLTRDAETLQRALLPKPPRDWLDIVGHVVTWASMVLAVVALAYSVTGPR